MLSAKGEFIAIFDADFTPPEDFFCGPSITSPIQDRHGADPVDAPQPQLFIPHQVEAISSTDILCSSIRPRP